MTDATYFYLALFCFVFVLLQYFFETAVYFTLFSKFTGVEIVTKKENKEKFKTALIIQIVAGCFFIFLELVT